MVSERAGLTRSFAKAEIKFKEAGIQGIIPDVGLYNALMDGHCSAKNMNCALELRVEMSRR